MIVLPTTPSGQSARPRAVASGIVAMLLGLALSGCGSAEAGEGPKVAAKTVASAKDGKEVRLFNNVFDCARQDGLTREKCDAIRTEAIAIAAEEAPRFEGLADCEKAYGAGKCVAGGNQPRRGYFSPYPSAFAWSDKSERPAPIFPLPGGGFQTLRGVALSRGSEASSYLADPLVFAPVAAVPAVLAATNAAKKAKLQSGRHGWNLKSRDKKGKKGKKGKNKG